MARDSLDLSCCLVLSALVIVFLTFPVLSFTAERDSTGNLPAEVWIREQVFQGLPADLKERFPNEPQRSIRGPFLAALLKDFAREGKAVRDRVVILNAAVEGNLFLEQFEADYALIMSSCRFRGELDLNRSHFRKGLWLDGSSFSSALLNGAEIEQILFLRDTVFTGSADFTEMIIHGNLEAKGVRFLNGGSVSFNSIRISGSAFFDKSRFLRVVDFGRAVIDGQFQAVEAEFGADGSAANFNSLRVGGDAFFNHAKFSGPADFNGAKVSGVLEAVACHFLESTNLSKTSFDRGLYLNASTFQGGVSLYMTKVNGNVVLSKAVLGDFLNFQDAEVAGSVIAQGMEFRNNKEIIDFSGMRIGGFAYFDDALFWGPVRFLGMAISGDFKAERAKFLCENESADFGRMRIQGAVFLIGAEFSGPVSFMGVNAGTFNAVSTAFKSRNGTVSLNGLKAAGDVVLNDSKFSGPADFVAAHISGNLQCLRTEFLNENTKIDFNIMKVDGNAFFHDAKFLGRASFPNMSIGGNLELLRTVFGSREANFGGIKIGGRLIAHEAQFGGPTSFSGAQITGSFEANNIQFLDQVRGVSFDNLRAETVIFSQAKFLGSSSFSWTNVGMFIVYDSAFQNTTKLAEFRGMKIETCGLNQTRFSGPVNFGLANISGNFDAANTRFLSVEKVNLDKITVGGRMLFRHSTLVSPLSLINAHLQELIIENDTQERQDSPAPVMLDLSQSKIERELRLENVAFKAITANSLSVEGTTVFKRVTVRDELSLEAAKFVNLFLSDLSCQPQCKIRLHGMQYQYVGTGNEQKGEFWKRFLELVNHSEYDSGAYSQFESFLINQGQVDEANEVHAGYKRREKGGIIVRVRNKFWELFTFHGRENYRALVPILVVLCFNCLLFRRRDKMELIDSTKECRYCWLWYSLDVILPIKLGIADVWRPMQDRRFTVSWVYISRLLGWILVPLGIYSVLFK